MKNKKKTRARMAPVGQKPLSNSKSGFRKIMDRRNGSMRRLAKKLSRKCGRRIMFVELK